MKLFVTGASGWIGSAVTRELLAHGHQVTGLARSEESAAKVEGLGAEVRRGDLSDTAGLAEAARAADGVVHLGYHHDFSEMDLAADLDRASIDAMAPELEGKPLVFASGLVGVRTEDDQPDPTHMARSGNALAYMSLADRGVRVIAARFAPTVHGAGDHGFVAELTRVARERGVSAYVGDGANAWAAVHRDDAAGLVRLALEGAPAGTAVHAVAEDAVSTREIAEAIGRAIGVPVESIEAERAAEHFGWIGMFFGRDVQATSAKTRELLGWEPTGPTLIEDIDGGGYTA